MCEMFNETNFPYDVRQDVSFRSYNVKTVYIVQRRCHTLDLNFGIWFLLISEIAQQNNFFVKGLKNGNQIDVHVGSAKYTVLI